MVQDDSVNSAAGRLRADIDRFREDLQKLRQDFANLLKHGLGMGRSATSSMGDRFKDLPDNLGDKVTEAIETKPLAVLGTAFAAGLLTGLMLSHHKD